MNRTAARIRLVAALIASLAALTVAAPARAQTDRIYFPAVHDVRSVLVAAIRAETVRIDMSAWLLTEHLISIALRDAFRRGVQVRLIGDRASIFETDPNTRNEFYWLASQGIPIRLRINPNRFPEIVHWKAVIFKGQRLVAFGSANFTPNQLAPASATNYSDETVLFTLDPSLVGAFLTRFDAMWNDTRAEPESRVAAPPYLMNWDAACGVEPRCGDYRRLYPTPVPMQVGTARLEPDRPMPADLVWGQGNSFNTRLVREIAAETRSVRMVVYRLTVPTVAQALLEKARDGVPVRLIVEPGEYTNRKWPEFWLTHANIDRLWAAGVPVKQRRHTGLTHMKMLVTSRTATNASSNIGENWQRDHNYFVPASGKPAIHRAMANRFDAMWNDAEGFATFVPTPPDRPALAAPASGAVDVSRTPALVWRGAAFATGYDVYLGMTPDSTMRVGYVPAQLIENPPETYSWAPPAALEGGTAFYWKIVAKTNATSRDPSLVTGSATWSFRTEGRRGVATGGGLAGGGRVAPAVFRRPAGEWYILGRGGIRYGAPTDLPAAADYDGDGTADLAVWRRSTGVWWILPSATSTTRRVQWGNPNSSDVPVPGDYDGDGRADVVVWRPGTGVWWILWSRDEYAPSTRSMIQWGEAGDQPVPADYDGDGATDIAIYRPRTGTWWVLPSGGAFDPAGSFAVPWGNPGSNDVPIPADYDGDARADIAVWRPEGGLWWVLPSTQGYRRNARLLVQWGLDAEGDVPVPGDYDGDGRAEIAVWRPGTGQWFIRRSSTGYSTFWNIQYGDAEAGDVPLVTSWPALERYLQR